VPHISGSKLHAKLSGTSVRWKHLTYAEDCQVCCKPDVLRMTWDKSAGEYTVSAELEYEKAA